jgi:RpiR family carbohydrate utilization transcriptional regulator
MNKNQDKKISYLLRIQREYSSMNKKECMICDYIKSCSKKIIHMTITELAEKCNTSEASIVRLSKKLGYKGFQAMKINIAQDVIEPSRQIYEDLCKDDTVSTIITKVFKSSVQTLDDTLNVLDTTQMEAAVNLITNAGTLLFFGVGGSGPVAFDAQHKFLKIGYLSIAFNDDNMQAMSASIIGDGDVVVAISHSGASNGVIEALEIARESGAKIIVITNYSRAPILKCSDVHLFTSSTETAFKSDALSSRIAELAILDALFVGVSFKKYDESYSNIIKTRKALDSKKI